jgi:hypothetical protein|tara:strand:- start:528 stop:842 length:315 start_codon:yes stop_codon:yes gene_type:complete
MIYYVNWLPFNYNGLATPFGIFITKRNRNSKVLLNHELRHYYQQKEGGLSFYIDYLKEHFNNGYDRNKYEIDARIDESPFCQKNYTHCVRNGLAKSAYNKNFRK